MEEGQYVASLIPGSKYVELDGIDHLPFVGEQDEILDPIEEFLTDVRQAEEHDRILATVLSVKIVAGTDDAAFARAQAHIRRQLELFKGREVPFEDGGVLATFDGPARAIRCAAAINGSADRLEVKLKTGLHTGECDVIDKRYSGYAVELAQKIADAAEPANTLVSRTVKDLVAGSGISFEDQGLRSFKGIDREWRLFAVVP